MNAILEDQPALDVEPGWIKLMESGEGKFTQHLLDGRHRLLADEPVEIGGNDRGPGPYELLLMALGACTTMTVRLYVDRQRWPLTRIAVLLRHERIYARAARIARPKGHARPDRASDRARGSARCRTEGTDPGGRREMPGPPHPDLGDQDPLTAGLRLTDAVAWCVGRGAIASATW
jgi:OsmC-like protein